MGDNYPWGYIVLREHITNMGAINSVLDFIELSTGEKTSLSLPIGNSTGYTFWSDKYQKNTNTPIHAAFIDLEWGQPHN